MKKRVFISALLVILSLINVNARDIKNNIESDPTLIKYNVAKWSEADQLFYNKWLK